MRRYVKRTTGRRMQCLNAQRKHYFTDLSTSRASRSDIHTGRPRGRQFKQKLLTRTGSWSPGRKSATMPNRLQRRPRSKKLERVNAGVTGPPRVCSVTRPPVHRIETETGIIGPDELEDRPEVILKASYVQLPRTVVSNVQLWVYIQRLHHCFLFPS